MSDSGRPGYRCPRYWARPVSGAGGPASRCPRYCARPVSGGGRPAYHYPQYCASLPIERYMQSAFSSSWSTASRFREVSRSITSSGG